MSLVLVAGILLLAGCGMEPFDPPRPDELQPGPGILTGESGELVIYRPGQEEGRPDGAPTGTPDP
jgi:hypothetical protein